MSLDRDGRNTATDWRVRAIPILLLVCIVMGAFLIRFLPGPQTVDDAYITFRYAAHLSEGNGLVYNPGHRVLGTTSPLYAVLLGGGAFLFGRDGIPAHAATLNAFFDAATVTILFFLLRRLGASVVVSLGASLLFALSDQSMIFSRGGMETSLFVMLLLGASLFFFQNRFYPAFFLAALAVLTRPDGILLGLLFATALFFHHRNRSRQWYFPMIAFVMPLLLWGLFAGFYYGSVLPHSMTAKQLAYRNDSTFLLRLYEYSLHAPRFLFGYLGLDRWENPGVLIWGPLAHFALFLAGAFALVRKTKSAWILPAFSVLYAVGICWKSPFLFQWYILGAAAFFLPVCLAGIEQATDILFQLLPQAQNRILAKRAAETVIVAIAVLIQSGDFHPVGIQDGLFVTHFDTEREQTYRRVAIELRKTIPADSRVALAEIGAFGFYHPAHVLDAVGLVSPEALNHYPLHRKLYKWNSTIPSSLIAAERPDYVVAFRDFMNNSLLNSPVFHASYRKIRQFPFQLWMSPGPWVYQLKPMETIQEEIEQARHYFRQSDFESGFQFLHQALYYSEATRKEALEILDPAFLNRLATLSPWDNGFSSEIFVDLEYEETTGSWLLLDRYGRIFEGVEGQLIPRDRVSLADLDAVTVDLEKSRSGWIAMDNFGRFYPTENSPHALPDWLEKLTGEIFPGAVDFEFTPDGDALYLADDRGEINSLSADGIRTVETGKWPEATAKDLELCSNGTHFYLLDGLGGIHAFGPESGQLPREQTHYWGWDIIRCMEFFPDGSALLMAAGTGSVHVYGPRGVEYQTHLPYGVQDFLVDFKFDPETHRIVAIDSNGRFYRDEIPK